MSARDDYPTLRFMAVEEGKIEPEMALDEIDRLREHARSLHRLNGWSKAKGWWCSCGAAIAARSLSGDLIEPRPWSPEGRHAAEIRHVLHVDHALRARAADDVALDRVTR